MSVNKSEGIYENGLIQLLPLYKDKLDQAYYEKIVRSLFDDMGGPIVGRSKVDLTVAKLKGLTNKVIGKDDLQPAVMKKSSV